MVAIRKKVGGRAQMRMPELAKGKKVFKIDCSVPAADGIFDEDTINAFEQHFQQNTKLHGRKGKLANKVKIVYCTKKNQLSVSSTMKYRKKYFKFLAKKFLKKKNLRDYLRVLSTSKGTYKLRYFNISNDEEAQE